MTLIRTATRSASALSTEHFPVPKPLPDCVRTSDGVTLALRRYARPGAQPVIMLNGVLQNMNAWDLPIPGRSIARSLSGRGFDVWLCNYRSHGRDQDRSEHAAHGRCSIDDLAMLDLPAVVDRVRQVTGRAPSIVGHSMGGIVTLMWLMGLQKNALDRVVHNKAESDRRNALITSIVLVGTPLPIGWDEDPGLIKGMLRPSLQQNLLYRRLFAHEFTLWAFENLREVPVGRAVETSTTLAGRLVGRSVRNAMAAIAGSPLSVHLWESNNMDRDTVAAEMEHALSDTPGGVLFQICDWIRHGTIREQPAPGRDGLLDYLPLLPYVRVPALMIAGDKDRSANALVARRNFAKMGSRTKEFVLLKGFGHNDLRTGKRAGREVLPLVTNWIVTTSSAPNVRKPFGSLWRLTPRTIA